MSNAARSRGSWLALGCVCVLAYFPKRVVCLLECSFTLIHWFSKGISHANSITWELGRNADSQALAPFTVQQCVCPQALHSWLWCRLKSENLGSASVSSGWMTSSRESGLLSVAGSWARHCKTHARTQSSQLRLNFAWKNRTIALQLVGRWGRLGCFSSIFLPEFLSVLLDYMQFHLLQIPSSEFISISDISYHVINTATHTDTSACLTLFITWL